MSGFEKSDVVRDSDGFIDIGATWEKRRSREKARAIMDAFYAWYTIHLGPVPNSRFEKVNSLLLVILTLFLGFLGIHRLYGGRRISGIIQCVLGISLFIIVASTPDASTTGEVPPIANVLMLPLLGWLILDLIAAFRLLRVKAELKIKKLLGENNG